MHKKNKKIITTNFDRRKLYIFSMLSFSGILSFVVFILARSYNSLIWSVVDSVTGEYAYALRSSQLTSIMTLVSLWGYYGTIIIWILLGIWRCKQKDIASVVMLALLSLGGTGLGYGLKLVVQRARPVGYALVHESNTSFPSMHVLSSTILYLTIAYLVYHYTHKFWTSLFLMTTSVSIIFVIGFSRVYLGVHYLSDCLAGFISGVAFTIVVICLTKLYLLHARSLESSK